MYFDLKSDVFENLYNYTIYKFDSSAYDSPMKFVYSLPRNPDQNEIFAFAYHEKFPNMMKDALIFSMVNLKNLLVRAIDLTSLDDSLVTVFEGAIKNPAFQIQNIWCDNNQYGTGVLVKTKDLSTMYIQVRIPPSKCQLHIE